MLGVEQPGGLQALVNALDKQFGPAGNLGVVAASGLAQGRQCRRADRVQGAARGLAFVKILAAKLGG